MALDKKIRVFPSPTLSATEYVPGLGPDGAELPIEQAEALIEAGLAIKAKPKPAAPAEKSEDPA